ncbi:Smr/MutS family protein [Rhodoferax sp.]|uniref:Smr/MutS family protein n=1 Tax=Rhodoferax sp. TaxID=50421 RepID=UPI00275A06F3|nr:Smr/MutS family protein [Rhodoferax sp.]
MSRKPLVIKSLADLKQVKKVIEDQSRHQAEQVQALAKAQRKQTSERDLFVRAAGVVQRLPDKGHAVLNKKRAPPDVMQRELDEQAALQESLSDEFDVATLLDVDEQMSFLRPGLGTDIPRKLRRGDWAIQRQLDLHGLRVEDAREALGRFIREAKQQGLRCVRIVHGKGLGSPGKAPVLKRRVYNWLLQKDEVLAFVQAKPADGGAGALLVLLAPVKTTG